MTEIVRRLLRTPQGALGACLVLALAVVCVLGPAIAPADPEAMNVLGRFKPPGPHFLLGSDDFGRDTLSRLVVGARGTLPLALAATLLGTLAGAVIGTLSAYLGGRWDEAIMRTTDAVLAIPGLLLALLVANTLGKGGFNAMLAIAVAFAPGMARVTRSVALTVRRQDYVSAA
ncbi:MAG: ABC transporter permease, partial [Hyphomicrobiales bacterium]|nr:ABC transporter permease [Hyphomicrobiales bacterium]